MKQNFAEVARLLHGVLEGSTSSALFAKTMRERGSDEEWLVAMGWSLREMGHLLDQTSRVTVQREKAQVQRTLQIDKNAQEALERTTLERDGLKKVVDQLEKEAVKTREQLDFLMMFKSPDDMLGGRFARRRSSSKFANVVGKVKQQKAAAEKQEQQEMAEAAARKAALLSPRQERLQRIAEKTSNYADHEANFTKQIELLKRSHKEEIARIKERLESDKEQQLIAFESREEIAHQRIESDAKRVAMAEGEAMACRQREASMRAKASAASEVLEENQMEMVALRQELERTKLALHTEREKHSQLAAQYKVMTTELQTMKAAKQAEEAAAKAAAIAAKKEAARLEEERQAMLMLQLSPASADYQPVRPVLPAGAQAPPPSPGSPGVKLLVPPPSREIGNAPGPLSPTFLRAPAASEKPS